ncbi:hypothetical protein IC582_017600 [Cucumis melo]
MSATLLSRTQWRVHGLRGLFVWQGRKMETPHRGGSTISGSSNIVHTRLDPTTFPSTGQISKD